METNRGKINSKEKQYKGGNWGHPKPYIKRNTEIDDPLMKEVPKHRASKKYKKKKEEKPFYACPFCGYNIEKKDKFNTKNKFGFFVWDPHETVCTNCHAFEIKNICPACKRDAWFKPDDSTLTNGEYAHISLLGCGFRGRRIERKVK